MSNPQTNATTANPAETQSNPRKTRLLVITALLAAAGIGYGVYWQRVLSHYEQTEDAYAAGNVVQVTPQIAGTVTSIASDDTEFVQAGQTLIKFDQSDAHVAAEQAAAQLAQTVREVRVVYANNSSLQSVLATRQLDLERARTDLQRRQNLANTGAISNEEIEHAKTAVKSAEAALNTAQQQLIANQALTDNTRVEQHPNVMRAAAKLREALLQESRTVVQAPLSGYVAKRAVQVGQRVAAGAPLLSIVPLQSLWVDANFKEVQLQHMRLGQKVELHADLYGDDVTYHGRVIGMSAGTGSAFALLPAQNASGNWIKVVQRVPVRIALDPAELAKHPLRIGVSMHARVDISDQSGASLASANQNNALPQQTKVFDKAAQDADERIQQIIQANVLHANSAVKTHATAKAST